MASSRNRPTLVFDAVLLKETQLAYLFVIEDEEVWLPKSRCEWEPSRNDATSGSVEMDTAIAREKGLD